MNKLFISHSSQDNGFVRELQQALVDFDQDVWIDSRGLRGGDPLWPEIQNAIENASAYAIVVSTEALQSRWVGKELRHAVAVQQRRGRDGFPIIPLSLNDTRLGVLEEFFGEKPIYISVSSAAGAIDEALNAILAALGKRNPATPQPMAELLEELVLELTDLKIHEQDGIHRASARARLVYEPATPGKESVHSTQIWRFITPIGLIETNELRWYLEKYAIWPSDYFRDRAWKVEQSLVNWGRLLYEAALPIAHTSNVMQAWARVGANASRRFSVEVDATPEAGAPSAEVETARESATLLLGLPWELLHDGDRFLFQGAEPTRIRRRLPSTHVLDVPVVATPIRILLVTSRPEDDACPYIDHRASALPLVEAMEALGGLVRIHVLAPPTLPALREELDRARRVRAPYHVVHFDGHGVYDRRVGLGGLCFEDSEDIGKLEKRRHITVYPRDLARLLSDHRVPLVFLEASQSAQAEKASESVASELLKVGVASVVAMTHSLLVEAARLFVEAFYDALARGGRVGDAMLHGRRILKDDNFRGRIFGAGELRLEDWFVPILFQEKDDPQLFSTTPPPQTLEDLETVRVVRMGELPAEPETGFIGRSRELLALQRLLHDGNARYAVVRGQGGEGKTALAAEFARWMVRSHQIRRAAFVSVETHGNRAAVLDAIGRQLVPSYSVATFKDMEQAILPVERALVEQPTLLVVDNMGSILLPPYLETSEALSEEAQHELDAILQLCERLNAKGDTRIVFTSREELPAPFDAQRNRLELHQLDREDAVKFVERALDHAAAGAGAAADATRESIEQLVDAVHSHASTLALLAPALRTRGVEATHASLGELMAEMERKFVGSREKSLFASVELSLRRMSLANQDRARVLGVFHGGVHLDALRAMMEWEEADVASLAGELIETGLATPNPYNHLALNPAFSPYVRGQLDATERAALQARWDDAMAKHVEFLIQQRSRNSELAATLTALDLPNLFALLERMERAGNPEVTVGLAASLLDLLRGSGRPRLAQRAEQVRDAATAALAAGSTAWFRARRSRIAQQLASGDARSAYEIAREVEERLRLGPHRNCYEAAYALWDLGRCATAVGNFAIEPLQRALTTISECREDSGNESRSYERLQGNIHCALGDEYLRWGRYAEAHEQYERALQIDDHLDYRRGQAHDLLKLAVVARCRGRFDEALNHCSRALDGFRIWDERTMEPRVLLEMGRAHSEAGHLEAAEDSYRKSLAIEVSLGNVDGQAKTLLQLGTLYDILGRPEEAVAFYRQAADKFVQLGDKANEGLARIGLGDTLRKLRRFVEARHEVRYATECIAPLGHVGTTSTACDILSLIETADGNPGAAAEAKRKAIECYLAYRRDGGENYNSDGRICLAVTQALRADSPKEAASLLQQSVADPDLPASLHPFIQAVQAIVAGNRDRTLADAPDLHYTMAAEILLLIETLEQIA